MTETRNLHFCSRLLLFSLMATCFCTLTMQEASAQKKNEGRKHKYDLSGTWESSTGRVQVIESLEEGELRFKNKGDEGWIYCEPVERHRSWYRVYKTTDESGKKKVKSSGLIGGIIIVRTETKIKVGKGGGTAATWTKVSNSTDYGYAEEQEEIEGLDLPEEEASEEGEK